MPGASEALSNLVRLEPIRNDCWEIERGLQLVERDRLVFVVTSNAGAEWLAQTLGERMPDMLPSLSSGRGPYGSRVSGILHFARGQPEFRVLVKPPIFSRPFWSPLVSAAQLIATNGRVARTLLRSTTRRLSARSWRSAWSRRSSSAVV